jgi:hypothetical protein
MAIKLTLNIINERIKKLNIKIMDIHDVYHVKNSYTFKCLVDDNHGTFTSTLKNIFKGRGCRKCSNKRKQCDIDVFRNKIKDQNIELVPETYNGLSKKAEFKCLNNAKHPNWFRLPNKQMISKGCPICVAESRRLSLSEVLERLSNRKDVELVTTTFTKATSPSKLVYNP